MRLLSLWLLAACAPEDTADADAEVVLARTLQFAREDEGVSEGFDLDGLVTPAGDDAGCGIADLTDPAGRPGVDNSFALFLPLIELAGGLALQALVQAAVDGGELLLTLELRGLDDPAASCVDLSIGRAGGQPMIGGDGLILEGQTFDRRLDVEASTGCLTREGDALVGEISPMHIGVAVFDELLDLTLLGGRVSLVRREDGTWGGVVGGALDVAQVQETGAKLDGIGDEIPVLIAEVLETRADIRAEADGDCDRMSAALVFEGVETFLYDPIGL